ncbi:hypothetical protein CAP31_05560 [Sulfuriferula sp. AH1]|nr:hypothetical protein CAP31_05560 [Sulfuriferula sp. AH1]
MPVQTAIYNQKHALSVIAAGLRRFGKPAVPYQAARPALFVKPAVVIEFSLIPASGRLEAA